MHFKLTFALGFLASFGMGINEADLARGPAANQLLYYQSRIKNQSKRPLTTSYGTVVDDKTNSMTAGPQGPIVLQDSVLIDELQHFSRQRLPERSVHAAGAGASGYFVVTNDITKYTKVGMFSKVGLQTPLTLRFSTVAGDVGSADTIRDIRGYAVKFYTNDGIWDIVGVNSPVFFMRDPILFPSFVHSQQRNPATNLKDKDMFWDYITLVPQTIHQIMILFSDRGIPDGYRHMNGYGNHAFKLVNKKGKAIYCKFHFKTNQGIKNLASDVAQELTATDPDYATKDLYNAIARGNYPSWNLSIQLMTFKQAETFRWNPFDVTKAWPQKEYPLMPVGRVVLNQNPGNYFADVEQAAFSPNHLVPGIEPSPDKMLHGRLFSYTDAHVYRVGINADLLPVNSPYRSIIANSQRDGYGRIGDNQDGSPNYFPNSFGNTFVSQTGSIKPYTVSGNVKRYNTTEDDNYSQPRIFWRNILNKGEKQRLVNNIVSSLKLANQMLQKRALQLFNNVDRNFGSMVRSALRRSTSKKK